MFDTIITWVAIAALVVLGTIATAIVCAIFCIIFIKLMDWFDPI